MERSKQHRIGYDGIGGDREEVLERITLVTGDTLVTVEKNSGIGVSLRIFAGATSGAAGTFRLGPTGIWAAMIMSLPSA